MRLAIRYRTAFEYGDLVHESQNELRACPANDDRQTLLAYRVSTSPPARVFSFDDYWGTRVDAFGVREPHIFLEVVAEAAVETRTPDLPAASLPLAALADERFAEEHWEYLQPSPHACWSDRIRAEAASQAELVGDDVVGVALAVHRRVGTLLRYEPGSTYVGMAVDDVLDCAVGVCQDYAHLAVAMCRSIGLPSRYVSGYLFASDDATGADVEGEEVQVQTHAWFEAAIPGWGWLALDPTNRQAVGLRHVKIGHGRDYDDVSPLRGTYSGPPEASLDVAVDMRRLAELAPAFHQQQQQQQQ